MPSIETIDIDGFVVKAGFLKDCAVFVTGDGDVVRQGENEARIRAHAGGILAAAISKSGDDLITTGDDGRVIRYAADGTHVCLAEQPRTWIDLVACGPSGTIAYGAGRKAWVRFADGREKLFNHERAVGGLAFAPKGMRLAAARYDGATMWWVSTDAKPVELAWKGAHLGVSFSPDGQYLVTAMQENALHGWRLSDAQDMRMTGYPTKVKSFSWSQKGRYLATSGANAAIVWPFFGKNGPMGQSPLQLGARGDALVTAVACHPKEDVVAVGYQDGMILMCRFEDNAEVLLRQPGLAPIGSLCWSADGLRVAFGTEAAEAGVISLQ